LRQKKITERIALQEQQYLLHFTQNFVPKHYDWRTGKFNENSLSLMQVNDIVLKRLEDIDDALSEGMTSKGFEYLYGGIVTYDIVSMSPTLVSSTFAQDLISASSEVTSYMFGPDFPGSHINSIGDYEVDSSRKVNVNAYYDSTFGSASGYGGNFTLNTVNGPSGASRSSLESALGITLPSGITGNLGGTPIEGSAVQRTFTGAKPGNVINFNWGFTSSEKGLPYSIKVDDYAFVAISGRTTKFVSILGNGDVKGGSFRYRLQPSDIDGNGNVKVSIGVIDVYDRLYNTTLRVNNFGSLYAGEIGTIGDTTDAADLGTSVNNLAYHKKKKKQQPPQPPQPQQPSYMNIQVGDQQVVKVNNKTVTDTTRGIKDGKMDGRPTYTDKQGNLRVTQPKPQPKPQPKSTTTTTNTTDRTTTNNRTSITNVPTTSTYTPYTDAEKAEKDFSTSPSIVSRSIRSATDQARFAGDKMFQGNPAGRAPGLSNYWSPEPTTAATYSNPGKGKGIPGTGPNPTGTITTAQRPPGTPKVTRGITGTPQFKFPAGSPPPSNMLTQMADDAAVSVANKAAATTASKTLSRVVPVVSIGIAVADAGIRASNGDYAGAVLSGLSAVPGPVGWAGLGVQIATDAAGFTGGVKEQQEFDNYGDYIKDAGKIAKKNKIKIDRNAMLDLFLRELSKDNKLSDKDKEFLVAIFTDADGLEKDDVITFVKKIQKKLMNGKSIEEQVTTKKKRLKSVKDIGNYPGKPSPLGFPEEEPPKMVNGYHPDLVDGKKVSQRYNRLDPISAKAMPPTGNPHIDKKVKAAAAKGKDKTFKEFWVPIAGNGPTNSASQTFAFGDAESGIHYTVDGLGGQTYSDTTEVFGDPVPTPDYSQLALQGYTPPLSNEVMKRNKQDENLQKIKDTLKKLGTSWEEMRANNWALVKPDGTSIILEPITPGNKQLNWIDNSKITVGKKHRDAGPNQNPYKVRNPDGSITMEFSEIESVIEFRVGDELNKQLDASEKFTKEINADEFMKGRVTDTTKPAPKFGDDITDPNNPDYNKRFAPITAGDEYTIDMLDQTYGKLTTLYPDLRWTQKLAIDYAKGNLSPRKVSPGKTYNAGVLKAIEHNLGVEGVALGDVSTYNDMNPLDIAKTATTRLSIGRWLDRS
jgi:hypothetical protein